MPNSDEQTVTYIKIQQVLPWIVTSLFVFPFFWYRRSLPLPNFYGEWVAIFLGLFALLVWLIGQRERFFIPSVAFFPIGLALLIGVQLSVMPDIVSSHARLGMVYLLFSAALMTAIFNAKPLIKIETLAAALLIGALLNCGHDWYRIVFEDAKILDGLGQKNNYTDYLMLGVISLCYLYAQKRFATLFFLLLLAPLIITSASLSQRSSWLYFIGLFIFTLAKAYKATSKDTRLTHSTLFATASFVLATIILSVLGDQQSSLERLMNSGETELGSSSRLWIWKSAWKMILAHPWLGVGFGNFNWTYFVTAADYASSTREQWAEHAHNIILHLFAELGIFAPLSMLLSLVVWLKAQRDQPFNDHNWWIWSCIGIIGIHSLLEYPLWYAFFLAPFTVLIGMTAHSSVEVRLPSIFRLLGCLLIGAVSFAGGNLLVNYLRLETFIIHLTTDERSVDPAELDTIAHSEPMLRPHIWRIKALSTPITVANASEWLPFLRQINRVTHYPDMVLKQIVALRLSGNQSEAIELSKPLAHTFPDRVTRYLADTNTRNAIGPDIAEAMQPFLPRH